MPLCDLTTGAILCYFVAVKNFVLLIGARLRDDLRWAGKHIYSWLILPPIVVAFTYATVARSIHSAPVWNPSAGVRTVLSAVVILCLVGINLSRATAEIFYLRQPESIADPLPVNISTKLHVALVIRITRTLFFGLVVLALRYMLNSGVLALQSAILPVVALCCLLAVTEIHSAVNWVHWNAIKSSSRLLIAIVLAVPAIVAMAFLGIEIVNPNQHFAVSSHQLSAIGLAFAIGTYLYSVVSHEKWRSEDMDYARRLWENRRSSLFDFAMLYKRLDPITSNLLARDLQLTLRIFSSALYIVVILALFWLALLAIVLRSNVLPPAPVKVGWFDATWLPTVMAAKFVAIFATTSLSILVAPLLAAQLPQLWLEKVTGVNGLQLLKAKILYTAIISLPAPILVAVLTLLTGQVPLFYAVPLLLECLFLWWCASSFVGALSFEMPNQPIMATIFMLTVGTAFPLLISLAWPIGLIVYAMVLPQLVARGRSRARVYLLGEAD